MKSYIVHDPWQVIEDKFHPAHNEISESIFSIGNGRMGQRANFEEFYSGKSLQGSYLAGIYYPDKTRVGWWKNGYPEYFAKVINSVDWIGLDVLIDGERLDLAKCDILSFERRLDMKSGILYRSFVARMSNSVEVSVEACRMYHVFASETASLQYDIQVLNRDAQVEITAYLEGDVVNRDSNYEEKFWEIVDKGLGGHSLHLVIKTKKTDFVVRTDLSNKFTINDKPIAELLKKKDESFVAEKVNVRLTPSDRMRVEKYVSIVTSENHEVSTLEKVGRNLVHYLSTTGFEPLKALQQEAWQKIWNESDIQIEGDVSAQQAIRFNIFQLYQTYTGEDARLNIGPKGFTGEKYGGVTYWDTEAYCLPFYLATQPSTVARNLLLYRYKHLQKAIENAEKLGFKNGAALYPMVTINGEECHNEWEITFEEIHRNGAIAFAIYNYVRSTDDTSYILEYGLEVLIGISRFWAQRVNWSAKKEKYVILGVTGPNEYENNVNNNWYTNTIAAWCLKYTSDTLATTRINSPRAFDKIIKKVQLKDQEIEQWRDISRKMFFPVDDGRGIYLQQDGFLDKELMPASDLSPLERPLNQHWSWDRILRSCFIKQADVLQGIYLFEDQFDITTIRRNYDFYEPMTVHESSLSPCVHAIIAAKLGDETKAYEFYLRTSRLDLDDYNNDTEDGLHITSMAGTWMAIVEGFAGMRVKDGQLHFNTFIPKKWNSYAFHMQFRGIKLYVKVSQDGTEVINKSNREINLIFNGKALKIKPTIINESFQL